MKILSCAMDMGKPHNDEYVGKSIALFDRVAMDLVGIGVVQPSALLAESGNIFSSQELDLLVQKRAVGDVVLRFFDHQVKPIDSELDKRVISEPVPAAEGGQGYRYRRR
jgi:DNA-binding transcriptional regulator LsrR (DeoR family)